VLAAAASYPPLTLTVNVATNAPASVTNSVTVSGGGELNTANNAASDPTTVTGPPAKLAITAQPSNANSGAAITPPIVVQVQDAAGVPVTISAAQINMAIGNNPGGGTLGGTVSVNAVGGTATFSTLTIDKGGPGYTLTASSAGLTSVTSSPFNIISALVLVNAKSRKLHGAAGTFDLALSLTPTAPTTEPRIGPAHTLVFTFNTPVTGGTPTVIEGTATLGSATFDGNEMIVPLTGTTNQQYVTVSVTNVSSADGGTGGSGSVRIGFLVGDVNGNGVVTLSDLLLVNAVLTQPISMANFLRDVNASGTLTLSDKLTVNANLTQGLPAP
jgi:hypothetical protein